MKKMLLFIIILIPCILFADSINFEDVKIESDKYILKYQNNNKYILDTNVFGFNESGFYIDEDFSKSGLLNFFEYNVIGGKNSYLNDGLNYYTMSYNDDMSQVYEVCAINDGYRYISLSESSGTRYTNFIKPKVKVSGSGSYNNPWVFLLSAYSVSYNLNYDNVGITKVDDVYEGDEYSLMESPIREGYVFSNWNLMANGNGDSYSEGANFNVKTDTIFYAIWTKKHLVKYDLNGGSGSTSSYEVVAGNNHTIDSIVPIKDGYIFLGWSINKNSTTADYKSGDSYTVNGDVTFYAIWQKKYTVMYDANGGTGGPGSDITGPNDNYVISSSKPAHTDSTYGFKNWNTKADGSGVSYNPGSVMAVNNDVTLYAQYAPYIARIDNVYYFSISEAVNAVNNNKVEETITMVRSTSENVSIANTKKIVLNLNSLTVTGKFTNNGILKIASAGIIQNKNAEVIINNGTLNISNGTFKNSATTTADIIVNNGTMNFSGGTVSNTSETSAVRNTKTLNISGGTIKNTYTVISNDGCGVENISGGTVEVTGGLISASISVSVVNFGTFNGRSGTNIYSTSTAIETESTGVTNIYGGYYEGGSTTNNNWPVLEVIEGGVTNVYGGTIEDTNTSSGSYGTVIQNFGTFYINGGTLTNNTGGGGLVHNYGTFTVTGNAKLDSRGGVIASMGTLTISGGTFINDTYNFVMIQNAGYMTVSNVNISHTANIFWNMSGATFYLNSGTYNTYGSFDTIMLNGGSFIMNGGTVTNTGGYKAIYKKSGASATIKGGSVSSKNW